MSGLALAAVKPTRAEPVTAAAIRSALLRRYPAPEWALLFEVGDATGARHTRFADALAMSLWPSRGLELWGMEIKVSKWDWQKERAQPQKAETIAAYCDRWYLITGPGVVGDVTEVPPAWGWLEFDGTHFYAKREAAKTEAKVCDRTFLAALLRRASKTDDALLEAEIERRDAARREDFDREVERAASRRASDVSNAIGLIDQFEAASGIKIAEWRGWAGDGEKAGRVFNAILASGIDESWQGIASLAETLRSSAQKIDDAFKALGFAPREKTDEPKRRRRRGVPS